jgi:pseudaminic acid synthase
MMTIGQRKIGFGHPVYIIAELSANHGQQFEKAIRLVHLAHEAGADAIKLQTYTPDTLTLKSDQPWFRVSGNTLWDGRTLHDLYAEAYTPWEWQPKLQAVAHQLGMDLFSSPFDPAAVDFLEKMRVPAYKLASFELVDIPLIQYMARTGKPLLISTGMATLAEIDEAVVAARAAGAGQIALLHCNSAYPAPLAAMNLRMMPMLQQRFDLPVGLSDHTLGHMAAITSVSLGGCIIEKHFTESRALGGPDSAFSLEPSEFRQMVQAVREVEQVLGQAEINGRQYEDASRRLRRSLFIVKDVDAGDILSAENVRSIRPALGLHPRHLPEVLGRAVACDLIAGTPLQWNHLAPRF